MTDKPEQALHKAVAKLLRGSLRSPTVWSTFPAGGGGALRGAFLKEMGLRAGMPDLQVTHPHPQFGVIQLGIELKVGKGKLSPAQIDTHAALTMAGWRIAVCRSLEEVEAFIKRHGVPFYGEVARREAA